VNCEFRKPAAMVRAEDKMCLVDPSGYVLPGRYEEKALADCGFLEIRGATGTPPAVGLRWANPDLQAGLDLVKLIDGREFTRQLRAVDVSNHRGRLNPLLPWIVLVTDRDTSIRWGLPPGKERGLEIGADEKVALLMGIYRQHGHVDFGRSYVDVRRSAGEVDVSIASAKPQDE